MAHRFIDGLPWAARAQVLLKGLTGETTGETTEKVCAWEKRYTKNCT